MELEDLKNIVVLITLIALIAGAAAISLGEFRSDLTGTCASGFTANGSSAATLCDNGSAVIGSSSYAYNATTNGLTGVDNSTSFLGVTGTIAGVAVLIALVLLAFTYGGRQ